MIKISPITKQVLKNENSVTQDEIISILENNRTRIRSLGSMILTVCGLLMSTSFIILFFIFKEASVKTSLIIPILLFSIIGSLTISIILGVFSAYMPTPTTVCTKLELVDVLTNIYRCEHRRITISIAFLLLGVILFSICLIFFAVNSF